LITSGTGWIPDPPDPRDWHPETPEIQAQLTKVFGAAPPAELQLPPSINLQEYFPEPFDQGSTNSCTANALAGLVDYFENRVGGTFVAPARLFIYKATRNLIQSQHDGGAYLRTAMESLVLFGAPPEAYWPFAPATLPLEPPAFLYAFASNYRTLQYYRYDPDGTPKEEVLQRIKAHLAAGLPAAFGFYLFESIAAAAKTGDIPFPGPDEKGIGGHAVVAVGYDDAHVIAHPGGGASTTGAFRIRNSWSPAWGEGGYGWLPYEYLLRDLSLDWWSILKADWFDLDQSIFKIPGASSDNAGGEEHERSSSGGVSARPASAAVRSRRGRK
jgi:C1A family cysteine protease